MTNEPFWADRGPVPEGHVLIEGTYLTSTARSAGVAFRVAVKDSTPYAGKKSPYGSPVGILILSTDEPAMRAALEKKAKRRDHERSNCDMTKRC